MHELSIALSLLDAAAEAARAEGAERICVVHVRVSALAGIVRSRELKITGMEAPA
jgi:Zn finger protein HypA/HybF involved in hydrogenase expression